MKFRIAAVNRQQASIEMGEFPQEEYVAVSELPPIRANHSRKVSVLPLVFLIFYEVSGGPFGVEDTVQAAGPLLALLGFLIFPLVWSIPEALITAELGTMFPENSGYVVWVSSALGPYWGFQQGWMKWLSGVIDNALYPVLFLDYLKSAIPALGGGLPRVAATWGLTIVLTFLNYRGMVIVGWVAVCLGIFSLLPFVVMGFLAIPDLEPSRWTVTNLHDIDWNLYLNTLFWNLNYWDSISTLSGEVENPKKTLPRALFYAVILVVIGYFFPLLIGTGAVPLNRDLWTDGYFSDIAMIIGGAWLRWWLQAAAAMSNMGMFVAEMSSDAFQLLGMAERGMLPEIFSMRSRHGTPLIGILFSASGVILLSWMSFQEIVAAENFLYCFGMILEFIAFILLRIKHPNASRPYKIAGGTVGAFLICIPPTILIGVVLFFSSLKIMFISLFAMAIGLVLQPCLKYAEKKRWMKFSNWVRERKTEMAVSLAVNRPLLRLHHNPPPLSVAVAPQFQFHCQPKLKFPSAGIRCFSEPSHFTDKTLISIKPNTSHLNHNSLVCRFNASQFGEQESSKAVEAFAVGRNIRMSANKARRVIDQIRGRKYDETLMILELMPYRACEAILKIVFSAGANASNNLGLSKGSLVISKAEVNEGKTMKRVKPVSRGRAHSIKKRTCHITITVKGLPSEALVEATPA